MSNLEFRRLRKLGLVVLVILLLAGCNGNESSSNLTSNSVNDAKIRLLTYNIQHGADAQKFFNLDATIATIRKSGANIIALQEVDRNWGERSKNKDEAQDIADQLGMKFVFGATLGGGKYGIMILSKFPFVAQDFCLLPSALEQRGVLCCTLQTQQGNIQVCCTHLGLTSTERKNQIDALMSWLSQRNTLCPLLLMGDFNTTSDADELKPVFEHYSDLQAKFGLSDTGTFYYKETWKRIDYIFGTRSWNIEECQVLTDVTSDHRPVFMQVGL